jgi:hypothetical protein
MTFKIEIHERDRERILDWMANRGGVAIWSSLDLSRAGQRTFTPADATQPSWHFNTKPDEIVTDRADIGVYTETLFKAFPVSLRRSSSGMTLKLTDPSQRKVDRHMEQCHEKHGNAHYQKGVLTDKAASIGVYYAGEVVPL